MLKEILESASWSDDAQLVFSEITQIIENLYNREYISGKSIEVTKLGMQTIATLKKYSPEIIEDIQYKIGNAKLDARTYQTLEKAKDELEKSLRRM